MRLRKGVSRRQGAGALRRRLSGLAVLGVLAALLGVLALSAGDAPSRASAAPSAPGFLGLIAKSELPTLNERPAAPDGGVAVDRSSGDVYYTTYREILKLTPFGQPIYVRGAHVNQTKTLEREAQEATHEPVTVTAEEEDLCTAQSGDRCATGGEGAAGGEFKGATGVAVDQKTGRVYVVDKYDHRVEELDSSGRFLLAFGRDVNKAAVEAVRAKEAAGETPTAAELQAQELCVAGEVCQEGRTGSGDGQFESWPYYAKAPLAVGGPSEEVYVGGKGRIQVFNSAGEWQKSYSLSELSATGSVTSLAVDSAGDMFFAETEVHGVHEIEASGALAAGEYDAGSSGVQSVGLTASGDLLVADGSPSFRVLDYEAGAPAGSPAEFAVAGSEGGLPEARAIAEGAGATVYLVGKEDLALYGSLGAFEAAVGPSPLAPSVASGTVAAQEDLGTATIEMLVDPQLRATTYQFEYGLQPCAAGGCAKVPAAPATMSAAPKLPRTVSANVEALQIGAVYHFRLVASSKAGTTTGPEFVFTIGRSSQAGPVGLPDGRVYEQVSPPNKDGNQVQYGELGLAAADGNAALFRMTGGAGEASSGDPMPYVSRRTPGAGWTTASAVPRDLNAKPSLSAGVLSLTPSAKFTRFVFGSTEPFTPKEPEGPSSSMNLFISSNPFEAPIWLGEPAISDPIPLPGLNTSEHDYFFAGGTPDLSTVFFTYSGTLIPEDAGRAANVGAGESTGKTDPWGLYEWHAGVERAAGVLPDGKLSSFGAVPASLAPEQDSRGTTHFQASSVDNVVSDEGRRLLFVSPDPAASVVTDPRGCEATPPCSAEPPELYLRETLPDGTHRTVLVSKSELPGHVGEPAQHGPAAVADAPANVTQNENVNIAHETTGAESGITDAYGTPNGSRVFFASVDRLTNAAPANESTKEYEFNVASGRVSYLPGVVGPIVATAADGSSFMFENPTQTPMRLDLWKAEGEGGSVREIAVLPLPPSLKGGNSPGSEIGLPPMEARASVNGAVYVFDTPAILAGGFNNGGGFQEVYRYETESGQLSCISCPGAGAVPAGNANISYNDHGGKDGTALSTVDSRVISADGSRAFFDTPTALVPQATNGQRNVYEWENGEVYLISSGTSANASRYMDSSESGGDVFFETTSGLLPGDTDGSYDVYDARVPRPGDNPPPSAVPCKGSVCQGPPSVPNLLGAPGTAAFSGPGDLVPPKPPASKRHASKHHAKTGKARKRRRKLRRALRRCRRVDHRHSKRRHICVRRARRRYGRARSAGRRHKHGRHRHHHAHNRRGN